MDVVVLTVAHTEFNVLNVNTLLKQEHIIFDVKGCLDRNIVDGRL